MISAAEISMISAATLPQLMNVWTENPSATEFGGRFDILAASDIRCRRVDQSVQSRGTPERTAFSDQDRLVWDPTYELPIEPSQIEIGEKRFQVVSGSVRERLGPMGEIMSRTAFIVPVSA